MKVSTTMCSGIANCLVAARALNEDTELAIPMRAQSRITLAPESGGGRTTAARIAHKLGVDVDLHTTYIIKFAKLLA
eukprot:2185314-Pleurochrysis_carterae.AAC.1